ncbi:MAG: hypothetical protein ACM33T_00395 [Solirubrobacterales bacterium]
MSQFFSPYIRFLIGAAYNVQQTLDGLHLHSSNFVEYGANGQIVDSYWSAQKAIVLPLGMLMILAVLICIGLLLSSYVIGRWKGVLIAILLISLPGLASLADVLPAYDLSPGEYVVSGTGILGELPGMVPLVVLALAAGWSLAVVGSDLLDLGDRYRNLFDHVWYAMAVITGLFFVGDNAASRLDEKLAEAANSRKFAAGYLARQLRDYSAECRVLGKSSTISCQWASFSQERLIEYSHQSSGLYGSVGPETTADIYQVDWKPISPGDIIALRREILATNIRVCPIVDLGNGVTRLARPSDECQRPPSDICHAFPEPLDGSDGKDYMHATVHVASECIVPTLIQFRQYEAKLTAQKQEIAKNKHLRWLFYICFSILAGAKVANATAKTAKIDDRPLEERRRLFKALQGMLGFVWRAISGLWSAMSKVVRRLHRKRAREQSNPASPTP